MSPTRLTRSEKAQERREAIVEAATAEFVANGFAATRIEDIAARAGVAKGTVYLNFADKRDLFESVVKTRMLPIVATIAAGFERAHDTVRETVEALLDVALPLLSEPRTGDILRLVVSESIRFPDLTGFYRREVIGPTAARMGGLLKRAAAAGELTTPAAADYPLLVVAPLILAIVANGRLQEVGVTDMRAMLRTHLDGLFAGRRS